MSGYIGATPVPQATQHREAFTATASQTSFATVGYTPQFVDVYLNGVKLAAADYTATNGSDIVLTTGAALNDILEYVAYTPFEVADQTFTGTTTVTDSGAAPLVANRTTSDGDITVFQKDGTVVGSIGATQSGVNIYYAGGAGKSGVEYSNTAWRPWYDGARADNSIDLGTTVNRFKDLYLSGGAYIGGTVDVVGSLTAQTVTGDTMSSHRASGGYGTGNSASVAVSSTAEGRQYQVMAMRATGSLNNTNAMSIVTYSSNSRGVTAIKTGTGISITESAGVISATNTSTAAVVYISVTRMY